MSIVTSLVDAEYVTDHPARLIAITIARLHYIYMTLDSSNPTLTGALAGVTSQTGIWYSIMAATIPCLRPFLAGFVTNFGAMGGDTVIGKKHESSLDRPMC